MRIRKETPSESPFQDEVSNVFARLGLMFKRYFEFDAKRQRESMEAFKPSFDEPPQSSCVVLDSHSSDEKGNPVTTESLFLDKLLEQVKMRCDIRDGRRWKNDGAESALL